MGFFDDIKNKIFGNGEEELKSQQNAEVARKAAEAIGRAAAANVANSPAQASETSPFPSSSGSASTATQVSNVIPSSSSVDVEAVMDAAVAKSGQDLNWKTSIVDLLKALDLDSSITARKNLADELGYTGDQSDSATMNIWLHKQVLAKLATNGGKVPETLTA
ncbi:MAG: DUF3597 domain-containing protein [Candidatus Devosia phytovorans]|uniref:DUF3597 domain-containing protein n=1 Tax=Candidatus Devosia phytovorans TaxID=3121372 RepID=A0AAJ5VTJ5_9HYPH|nr:DUF3597 domain-containing protein [Devosia sp.]WEK03213.1 MAG: DUF3597 domain-containing protein [Devosia sp.]